MPRPMLFSVSMLLALAAQAPGQSGGNMVERARLYLLDLIKLDSTNPRGNETRVAAYLKKVADAEGISSELLGPDPARLNFVARLGSGAARPLLLMAHSDVVPADRSQWTVPPFSALVRDGFIYGRGAQDDKSLLAAELAVVVELKRRGTALRRPVILLSEADEEADSSGIQWLIRNAYAKIDAEFAINEGGFGFDTPSGPRVFQVQTAEKIPSRVTLIARGTAGHGSLPRPDNPVVHLSRAIVRLADADQPVRLNTTTRRYFRDLAKLQDYRWVGPYAARLETEDSAIAAANEIRDRDPELDAQLRATMSPTMLNAGIKINVIPNIAEGQVDIRRLPNETREEIVARVRRLIGDPAVEVSPAPGQTMPATEPSSLTGGLYLAMEKLLLASSSRAVVIPYMSRGATDGAFLREKGMAVYGAPLFLRENNESRAHGNDERISLKSLETGVNLLWQMTLSVTR
jgi:acetylornithine deacetylase/succinyl-diaminopimelate desuccinylase-like protein